VPWVVACLVGVVLAWSGALQAGHASSQPAGAKRAIDMVFASAEPATTLPAAEQATASQPAYPFAQHPAARQDARPGVVVLSDGRRIGGWIFTTRDRAFRVYDARARRYRDILPGAIATIRAHVDWARMERSWRWQREGADAKVFTGRSYPVRKLSYTFTLVDGTTVSGQVSAPLYVQRNGKLERFALHKRQRGPVGSTLAELIYIDRVIFSAEAMRQATTKPTPRTSRPARRPCGGTSAGGGPDPPATNRRR